MFVYWILISYVSSIKASRVGYPPTKVHSMSRIKYYLETLNWLLQLPSIFNISERECWKWKKNLDNWKALGVSRKQSPMQYWPPCHYSQLCAGQVTTFLLLNWKGADDAMMPSTISLFIDRRPHLSLVSTNILFIIFLIICFIDGQDMFVRCIWLNLPIPMVNYESDCK